MCKYALVTLTGGHRISMPLLHTHACSCVWSPPLLKGKRPNKKQCWDLYLKMTELLILCCKYILIHILMTIQLWIEKSFHIPCPDRKHGNWIQNATGCLQEVNREQIWLSCCIMYFHDFACILYKNSSIST